MDAAASWGDKLFDHGRPFRLPRTIHEVTTTNQLTPVTPTK